MWKQRVSKDLRALTYSHDGRTLYSVEANNVVAWDIEAKKPAPLFQIGDPQQVVTRVYITANGQYLILATLAGRVVWDLAKGERRPDFPPGWGFLVPARSGCEVRHMGKNQTAIRIYDPSKGKDRKFIDLVKGIGKMYSWALSPDDKRLLLASPKGAVILQAALFAIL
jgi:hypothetical protein